MLALSFQPIAPASFNFKPLNPLACAARLVESKFYCFFVIVHFCAFPLTGMVEYGVIGEVNYDTLSCVWCYSVCCLVFFELTRVDQSLMKIVGRQPQSIFLIANLVLQISTIFLCLLGPCRRSFCFCSKHSSWLFSFL